MTELRRRMMEDLQLVDDVASDVYEGRVAVYSAGIEDDPSHEEQEDGFDHYGWESKNEI